MEQQSLLAYLLPEILRRQSLPFQLVIDRAKLGFIRYAVSLLQTKKQTLRLSHHLKVVTRNITGKKLELKNLLVCSFTYV